MAAYAAAVEDTHAVPVEVFEGSISEAMGQAAAGNTKDKLGMTSAEKSNAAWRMVVAATGLSKARIAGAAGVSERTVASMRLVLDTLAKAQGATDVLGGGHLVELRNIDWREAKRQAENRGAADFDHGAWAEQKAQAMALAIRKAIGGEGGKYPEVLARALDIYDTRLADRLVGFWSDSEE